MIAELSLGSNAVSEYARGIEKLIRIQHPNGVKEEHADADSGNAIIEFEKNLNAHTGSGPGTIAANTSSSVV